MALLSVVILLIGEPVHVLQYHCHHCATAEDAVGEVLHLSPNGASIFNLREVGYSHEDCQICRLFWVLSHTTRFSPRSVLECDSSAHIFCASGSVLPPSFPQRLHIATRAPPPVA